jgi:alcohol dehydrogenase
MNEPRILFGAGSLHRLPGLLPEGAKVALVTGERAARASRLLHRVVGLIWRRTELVTITTVPSHPDWDAYLRVVGKLRESAADAVLALGGGSVMDVAKHAASTLPEIRQLIAVPTLFGSGAEVTPFATVWNRAAQQKRSLPVRPCHCVLIDPLLAATAPRSASAACLLDALAHGADVLWQAGISRRDRARSTAAVRLVRCWFAEALSGQTTALSRMAAASVLGGLAIASVGSGASHALSYPLQLRFGVPHGVGCALGLLWLMRAFPEKVPADLVSSLGASDAPSAAAKLGRLIECGGFSTCLSSYGASPGDLGGIVAAADKTRLSRAGIRLASETLVMQLTRAI